MPWNPPVIVGTSFLDTESTDHKYLGKGMVARAAYDLQKGITFVRRVVSVEALTLTHGGQTYTTSYTEHGHGAVASNAATRLRYKLDSGPVTIGWTLRGHTHLTRARLELYRPNVLQPVWTHDLQWDQGAPSADGTLQLDPNTLVPFDFGDDLAVYKLRLGVPPGDYRRATMARWVYFVVEPPTWVKVKVVEQPGDVARKEVAVKMTPPGREERVERTGDDGQVTVRVPFADGPFRVAQLAYDPEPGDDEEEPLYLVTKVESA